MKLIQLTTPERYDAGLYIYPESMSYDEANKLMQEADAYAEENDEYNGDEYDERQIFDYYLEDRGIKRVFADEYYSSNHCF